MLADADLFYYCNWLIFYNYMLIHIIISSLLFISVCCTPTLTLCYSNGEKLDHVVLYKDHDSFPGSIRCDVPANWTLAPSLPMGLTFSGNYKYAYIRSIPTEESPETEYTITATTSEGTVSVSFTMEVAFQ